MEVHYPFETQLRLVSEIRFPTVTCWPKASCNRQFSYSFSFQGWFSDNVSVFWVVNWLRSKQVGLWWKRTVSGWSRTLTQPSRTAKLGDTGEGLLWLLIWVVIPCPETLIQNLASTLAQLLTQRISLRVKFVVSRLGIIIISIRMLLIAKLI